MMRENVVVWVAGIIVGVVGFVLGYSGDVPGEDQFVELVGGDGSLGRFEEVSAQGYRPSHSSEYGHEVVFVYIGSSGCYFSNRAWLPEVIDGLKVEIEQEARASGMKFRTIGVAKDWDIRKGIAHLAKYAPFTEISVGGNWSNMGITEFISRREGARPATPQVAVGVRRVERRTGRVIKVSESTGDTIHAGRLEVGELRILRRVVGAGRIRGWLEAGGNIGGLVEPWWEWAGS